MNYLVITILGDDKVGIVENIAQLVFKHNGNWEASTLTRLAGKFAGIVQVSLADSECRALEAELASIEDLQIVVSKAGQDAEDSARHIVLSVTGNDRAGIIQEISQQLALQRANVFQMDTICESAPGWGSSIFRAEIKADVPKELEMDDIKAALEAIADDIMIDYEVVQKF